MDYSTAVTKMLVQEALRGLVECLFEGKYKQDEQRRPDNEEEQETEARRGLKMQRLTSKDVGKVLGGWELLVRQQHIKHKSKVFPGGSQPQSRDRDERSRLRNRNGIQGKCLFSSKSTSIVKRKTMKLKVKVKLKAKAETKSNLQEEL